MLLPGRCYDHSGRRALPASRGGGSDADDNRGLRQSHSADPWRGQIASGMMKVPIHMDGLPLPRWVHVPGEGSEADHARLARAKALVPPRFEGGVPASHPALRYGLELNDAGFFWECHEILEAVWAVAPQRGRDRILLRACIQIANANLKQKLNRPGAMVRLLGEALSELDELRVRKAGMGGLAGGFPADALASLLRCRLDQGATAAEGPVMFDFAPEI